MHREAGIQYKVLPCFSKEIIAGRIDIMREKLNVEFKKENLSLITNVTYFKQPYE